jgi:hypothetical protein
LQKICNGDVSFASFGVANSHFESRRHGTVDGAELEKGQISLK